MCIAYEKSPGTSNSATVLSHWKSVEGQRHNWCLWLAFCISNEACDSLDLRAQSSNLECLIICLPLSRLAIKLISYSLQLKACCGILEQFPSQNAAWHSSLTNPNPRLSTAWLSLCFIILSHNTAHEISAGYRVVTIHRHHLLLKCVWCCHVSVLGWSIKHETQQVWCNGTVGVPEYKHGNS